MTIEVRLFANLARYLPAGSRGEGASLEVAEGTTIEELLRRLGIPPELPGLLLVDGQEAPPGRRLRTGDVLTVVPPLAGGSALPGRARAGRDGVARDGAFQADGG